MELDKLPEDVRALWDGFLADLWAMGFCSEAKLIKLEQALWALHRQSVEQSAAISIRSTQLFAPGTEGAPSWPRSTELGVYPGRCRRGAGR